MRSVETKEKNVLITPNMKQQILEEFENEFYGVLQDDGGLGKRGDKIGNLDGFLPPHLDLNDIKSFLSSSIDRVLEEARKCVPEERKLGRFDGEIELDELNGFNDCRTQTLQALDKLKV